MSSSPGSSAASAANSAYGANAATTSPRPARNSIAAAVACFVVAASIGLYAALGGVDAPVFGTAASIFCLALCGAALLLRERRSTRALAGWKRARPLLIAFAVPLSFYLIERPSNEGFLSIDPYYILVNHAALDCTRTISSSTCACSPRSSRSSTRSDSNRAPQWPLSSQPASSRARQTTTSSCSKVSPWCPPTSSPSRRRHRWAQAIPTCSTLVSSNVSSCSRGTARCSRSYQKCGFPFDVQPSAQRPPSWWRPGFGNMDHLVQSGGCLRLHRGRLGREGILRRAGNSPSASSSAPRTSPPTRPEGL